jgi:hypothetical protein
MTAELRRRHLTIAASVPVPAATLPAAATAAAPATLAAPAARRRHLAVDTPRRSRHDRRGGRVCAGSRPAVGEE